MDIKIEKKKGFQVRKHWGYVVTGCCLAVIACWLAFGNHDATLKVNAGDIVISEVRQGEFKEYIRTSGRVMPIEVVYISPEEGGIVMEKVVEEGSMVKKGDVIVRLSNSALDLQILNAEAELAEKQNIMLRKGDECIYAKVIRKESDGFIICFTSMSQNVNHA